MRGAAVAVMLGCAFGGVAFAAGNSHVISDVRLSSAVQPIPQKAAVNDTKSTKSAKTTKTATQAMKTVTYRGYSIQVPSSWPVYSLNEDPSKCVRYDVNAVYLGTPGPNQNCPPHLIGHADTVSIGGPPTPGEPSVPVKTDLRASVGAKRGGADTPVAPGTILQNSQLREYAVSMPGSAPAIRATYGRRPSLVLHLLASLHLAPQHQDQPAAQPDALNAPAVKTSAKPQPTTSPSPSLWIPPSFPVPTPSPTGSSAAKPSPTGSSTPKPSATGSSAPKPSPTASSTPKPSPTGSTPKPSATGSSTPKVTPAGTPSPSPTGTPSPSPSPTGSSATSPPPASSLTGFDTCTAPSLQAMKAWRPNYAVVAIYIGGPEMGCGYGNLSKGWVQSTEGMGWSLMPIYVGPQATCNSFSDEIVPSQAAAEGTQSANQAVADAASFGLGKGSPIYYDMEGYDGADSSCVTAVLTFLDAWDRQLQASGYVSGVYSSAASGVTNLQTTATIAGHPLAEPQAIWIALWDNVLNVTGSPYVTSAVWPTSARSKQYAGSHVVSIGGYSLDIDSDLVDGPVARG